MNTSSIEHYTNRGSGLFINALKSIESLLDDSRIDKANYIITYFDNNVISNRKVKELLEIKRIKEKKPKIFKIMPATTTWRIDDKREFCRIMKGSNHLPITYLNIDLFRKDMSRYHDNKIFFSKKRGGTGGKAVKCYTKKELETTYVEPDAIIQEGLMNIDLYMKKKYVIRSYILLYKKKSYLHKSCFFVLHGKEYDANSTDYDIQINHNGYNDSKKKVELKEFKYLYPDKPGMKELIFKKLKDASKEMITRFKDTRSSSSETDFIILGMDSILVYENEKLNIKFIECNRFPNIRHNDLINKNINERMLADTFCLFLNIENPLFNNYILLTN